MPCAIFGGEHYFLSGEWYFVYAYHDVHEDEIGISVNNGPVNTLAYNGGVRNGTSYLRLGSIGASQYFDGELDEWAIWDRTLTPQELEYLYNGGEGRAYPFGEPPVESEAPAPTWVDHAYEYDANHPHTVAGVVRNENTVNEYSDLYTYAANGNMTQRIESGVTWTQEFNAENRLSEISNGTDTWSFVYDGDGNRVKQVNPDGSVTVFLFGGLYSGEVVSGTVTSQTKYYAIAGQRVAMDSGGTLSYLLTDHLGSVVAVTDTNGDLVPDSEQRYLPFGEPRLAAEALE